MPTANRRWLVIAAIALAVALAVTVALFSADDGRRHRDARSVVGDDGASAAMRAGASAERAATSSTAAERVLEPSGASQEPVDWLQRMAGAISYSELAVEALPRAQAGNSDVQFMLSLIAMECELAKVSARKAARSTAATTPPLDAKCGSTVEILQAPDGGQSGARYWLERAVASRQAEALALQSMYTINTWMPGKDQPDQAEQRTLVEARLRLAVESGNPRALAYVAMAMGAAAHLAEVHDAEEVQMRGAAWGLLACRLGGCGPELGPFRPDFSCPTAPGQECLSTPDRQLAALQLQFGPDRAAKIEDFVERMRDTVVSRRWSDLDGYLDLGMP